MVDGILQDNINYINPNDIESMEILKDPSSLAIFGVRGATGVIAITTKRAALGKTVITLNTSYGFKDLVDKIRWQMQINLRHCLMKKMQTMGLPA